MIFCCCLSIILLHNFYLKFDIRTRNKFLKYFNNPYRLFHYYHMKHFKNIKYAINQKCMLSIRKPYKNTLFNFLYRRDEQMLNSYETQNFYSGFFLFICIFHQFSYILKIILLFWSDRNIKIQMPCILVQPLTSYTCSNKHDLILYI